jgi:serine/threonine protein kinase
MEQPLSRRVRFGPFELDLRAGELHNNGQSVILQEQQLQVLLMLIEREGETATRDELKRRLWPNDTIVEFDHSINNTIKNLRRLLGDSADKPRYIETVGRRGYRLMAPVEWAGADDAPADQSSAAIHTQDFEVTDPELLAKIRLMVGSLTGKVVSHYRVLEMIGGGGMGLVYRAEDLKLGRTVALKFLPEELGADLKARERFQREAKAVSALNHSNICTIYEFDEHQGHPFIVMEFLQGQTLRDHLAAGRFRLSRPEGLEAAIQIASGLEAAHERGIIHRDIKPANIFITEKNVAKILDFGVAKVLAAGEPEALAAAATVGEGTPARLDASTLTHTGMMLGTIGYMSPEQVRGDPLDARTDVFSMGTVLYEMATGRTPFSGKTSGVICQAILDTTPPPPSTANKGVNPKLDELISKCLEKDPELRYQSAAELRADLKRIKRDSDAQRVPAVSQRKRPARMRAWLAAIAAFVVVAMAIGSAFLYRVLIPRRAPSLNLQDMAINRLTDSGNIEAAAMSPDGRYIAYSVQEPTGGLWLQQIGLESKVQILPPSEEPITGIAFSPDGAHLYFVRDFKGYMVPALGGQPKLIIDDTFGNLGVSPDGTKLAFVHGGTAPKQQLLVVNSDGSGRRVIAEYSLESGISFRSSAPPSWSPDGKLIAVPAIHKDGYVLNIYQVDSGIVSSLSMPGHVLEPLWLPDARGILLAMPGSANKARQVWLQPYPSGQMQRLTNDLDAYSHLSISRDGRFLSAVQSQRSLTIWLGPASTPGSGSPIRTSKSDGIGLSWMRDGRLVSQDVDSELSVITRESKQVLFSFKKEIVPGAFTFCKNGHVVLATLDGGAATIWTSDERGRELRQLSKGPEDWSVDCSPDSQSVIYLSRLQNNLRLMKIPLQGGTPTLMSKDNEVAGLRYSPDGQSIADIEFDHESKPTLVIRDAQTGQPARSFKMPDGYTIPWNASWGLRWTPDGRNLSYLLWKTLGSPVNLWSQSLAGGSPRQVTNFPDEIVAYDWSSDGKQVAYTRSAATRDVVLISNFH